MSQPGRQAAVADDWWRAFFRDLWQIVFDEAADDREPATEIAFLREALECSPRSRVLDVPCGTGRLSLGLARAGCSVTGLDMLTAGWEQRRQLAAQEGLELNLVSGDMRAMTWQSCFDAALCFWGSFGYFNDQDNEAVLTGIGRALVPGGRFLLDVYPLDSVLKALECRRTWFHRGDWLVLEERSYDTIDRRFVRQWTCSRGEEEISGTMSIRAYALHDLVDALGRAGMAVEATWGDYLRTPYRVGRGRLFLLARKTPV